MVLPAGRPTLGWTASRLSPRRCRRRVSNDRSSRSCLRSGCSFMPSLPRTIAPSCLIMAAYAVERSRQIQACYKIARPPASRITYCFMIERHSLAPGSPKDDGGDGGVASTAILLMAKILTLVFDPGKISKSIARMQGAPRPEEPQIFSMPPPTHIAPGSCQCWQSLSQNRSPSPSRRPSGIASRSTSRTTA